MQDTIIALIKECRQDAELGLDFGEDGTGLEESLSWGRDNDSHLARKD